MDIGKGPPGRMLEDISMAEMQIGRKINLVHRSIKA